MVAACARLYVHEKVAVARVPCVPAPKMTEHVYFPTFDHCSDRLILPKVTEHDDAPTLVPYFHRLQIGALRRRRCLADPSALATREGRLGVRELGSGGPVGV